MDLKIKQLEELKEILPLLAYQRINDEVTLIVSNDKLLFSLNILKRHIGYN